MLKWFKNKCAAVTGKSPNKSDFWTTFYKYCRSSRVFIFFSRKTKVKNLLGTVLLFFHLPTDRVQSLHTKHAHGGIDENKGGASRTLFLSLWAICSKKSEPVHSYFRDKFRYFSRSWRVFSHKQTLGIAEGKRFPHSAFVYVFCGLAVPGKTDQMFQVSERCKATNSY